MAKTKTAWLTKKRYALAVRDLAVLQQVMEIRNDKKRIAAVRSLVKAQKDGLATLQKEAAKSKTKKAAKTGGDMDPAAMTQKKLTDLL